MEFSWVFSVFSVYFTRVLYSNFTRVYTDSYTLKPYLLGVKKIKSVDHSFYSLVSKFQNPVSIIKGCAIDFSSRLAYSPSGSEIKKYGEKIIETVGHLSR